MDSCFVDSRLNTDERNGRCLHVCFEELDLIMALFTNITGVPSFLSQDDNNNTMCHRYEKRPHTADVCTANSPHHSVSRLTELLVLPQLPSWLTVLVLLYSLVVTPHCLMKLKELI